LDVQIVDAASGNALPARVYIQSDDGQWHFLKSLDPAGSAVPYRKQRGQSVEMHTTLSAHPARAQLPPGNYTVTVERGKEYHPQTHEVTMAGEPQTLRIALRRWIDMAQRGWHSGDTHVHRTLDELPNVMLAEDLNVALPLLSWVREAFVAPSGDAENATADDAVEPIVVDPTHVIYPRNTEYEIFTVDGAPHTLGAFFVLNHQRVFTRGVPPVTPVARQARAEGGLIELDKHNWPWSMMLVPVIDVDLFELANNHVWRARFGFPGFGEAAAERMRIETDEDGFTEAGWLDFGFKNYYALLNCGYRLRPTAGTASGVHPVPLGFGRVYVHLPDGFSYDAWIRGLDAGRSQVTTGPMLFIEVDGQPPGAVIDRGNDNTSPITVRGSAVSAVPLETIEIVVNGDVVRSIEPGNQRNKDDAYECDIHAEIPLRSSSWIAVRCFEDRTDGRVRFAHTSPVHVDVAGKPLRPRRWEVEYFIDRVRAQLARSGPLLPPAARAEYEEALEAYEKIAETAR
jgi:hypothetical protein